MTDIKSKVKWFTLLIFIGLLCIAIQKAQTMPFTAKSSNQLLSNNNFRNSPKASNAPTYLIIEDNDPWGFNSIQTVLANHGINYVIINDAQIAATDFSIYSRIIIPSTSSSTTSLTSIVGTFNTKFETYVTNGGILEIHAASNEASPWSNGMPFGFNYTQSFENNVIISDSNSTILSNPNIVTASNLNDWSYSVEGYLSSVPNGTYNIINDSTYNQPVLTEYYSGSGLLLISTQTLEWAWAYPTSTPYSNFLENVLMFNGTPILSPIIPSPNYNGLINLSWLNDRNASTFFIFRDTTYIDSVLGLTPIAVTNTSNYLDQVDSSGNYYYAIMANCTDVNSSLSNCVNITVQIGPPIIPPTLQISPDLTNTGDISLSWNLISADNYTVFRNTSIITTTAGLTPLFTTNESTGQDSLTIPGTYFYVVIASNIYGNSTISNCVNTTAAAPLVFYQGQFGASGSSNGDFTNPQAIAINETGYVYVLDSGNDRVQIFDPMGNYISQFGSDGSGNGYLNNPWGIAINGSGDVYITDQGNYRVEIFSQMGYYLGQFQYASWGLSNGYYEEPYGIAINASGTVYVEDSVTYWVGSYEYLYSSQVEIFTALGNSLSQFGLTGAGSVNYPLGIAINSLGWVYITDFINDRVEYFDSMGNYLGQFGSSGTGSDEFNDPRGCTFNLADRFFIADFQNNRIEMFDDLGNYEGQFGTAGNTPGEFSNPNDVAINATGSIYVVDSGNNRIQIFTTTPDSPVIQPIVPNPTLKGSITISWNNVGVGYRYYLYRDTVTITSISGLNFIANQTSCSFTDDLESLGTYYYAVFASNILGNSSLSVPVSVVVSNPPGTPINLKAQANNNQIVLTWQSPSNNGGSPILTYYIYRGITAVSQFLLVSVGNLTQFTDSNLLNGYTYYYTIVAVNGVGVSSPSNLVNATSFAPGGVASPPQDLQISAGNGKVAIVWQSSLDTGNSAITGYNIYRGNDSSNLQFIKFISTTSYTDMNLTNGQIYYYAIATVNGIGIGNVSTIMNATPSTAITTPEAPQDVQLSYINNQIVITWQAPLNSGGSPILWYRIYRSNSPGSETFLAEVNNTQQFNDTYLNADNMYYYTITAVNGQGEGNASKEAIINIAANSSTSPFNWTGVIIGIIAVVGGGVIVIAVLAKKRHWNIRRLFHRGAIRSAVPASSRATARLGTKITSSKKFSEKDAAYDPHLDLTRTDELEIDPATGFYRKKVKRVKKK